MPPEVGTFGGLALPTDSRQETAAQIVGLRDELSAIAIEQLQNASPAVRVALLSAVRDAKVVSAAWLKGMNQYEARAAISAIVSTIHPRADNPLGFAIGSVSAQQFQDLSAGGTVGAGPQFMADWIKAIIDIIKGLS